MAVAMAAAMAAGSAAARAAGSAAARAMEATAAATAAATRVAAGSAAARATGEGGGSDQRGRRRRGSCRQARRGRRAYERMRRRLSTTMRDHRRAFEPQSRAPLRLGEAAARAAGGGEGGGEGGGDSGGGEGGGASANGCQRPGLRAHTQAAQHVEACSGRRFEPLVRRPWLQEVLDARKQPPAEPPHHVGPTGRREHAKWAALGVSSSDSLVGGLWSRRRVPDRDPAKTRRARGAVRRHGSGCTRPT